MVEFKCEVMYIYGKPASQINQDIHNLISEKINGFGYKFIGIQTMEPILNCRLTIMFAKE